MKFSTIFPHIKTMEFGFIQLPKVDFILRPLKGMDLMDVFTLFLLYKKRILFFLDSGIVQVHR